MKIGVVGAGAIGAWYGASLGLAGHETHFVLRSDYEAVSKSGYTLRDAAGVRRLHPVNAHRSPETVGVCDLVLIGLKTTANASFGELLTPLTGPRTTLLTLQNGMGNAEALAGIFGAERVLAGLCYIALNRVAPGVIENYNSWKILLAEAAGAPTGLVRGVSEIFEKAGVATRVCESLERTLWEKLCWNIPFNGLTIAAGGVTTDRILADPALVRRARALMLEIRAAAAARGFEIPESYLEEQFEITRRVRAYKPSSLIDFLENRPVEVEAIWGEPLRRGRAAGVGMPELEKLYSELLVATAARSSP